MTQAQNKGRLFYFQKLYFKTTKVIYKAFTTILSFFFFWFSDIWDSFDAFRGFPTTGAQLRHSTTPRERENKKITEQTVNKTEMALKENKQVSTRYKKRLRQNLKSLNRTNVSAGLFLQNLKTLSTFSRHQNLLKTVTWLLWHHSTASKELDPSMSLT